MKRFHIKLVKSYAAGKYAFSTINPEKSFQFSGIYLVLSGILQCVDTGALSLWYNQNRIFILSREFG